MAFIFISPIIIKLSFQLIPLALHYYCHSRLDLESNPKFYLECRAPLLIGSQVEPGMTKAVSATVGICSSFQTRSGIQPIIV